MDDKYFLQLAVEQAKKSVKVGGFSDGAIVVKDGNVISEGIGIGFKLHDPTSHPESSSMRDACKKLETTDLKGAILYCSIEPCLMCFSVASWSNISKVVYGCKKTEEMARKNYYEGMNTLNDINEKNNKKIELIFIKDYENDILDLIKNWEEQNGL